MFRVSLRSINRDYEIDHWCIHTPSLDEAKEKANKHAGHTLGWKNEGSSLVSSLGHNISYRIERYDPAASTDPSPRKSARPTRV